LVYQSQVYIDISSHTKHVARCFITVFSLVTSSSPEWGPSSGHHTRTWKYIFKKIWITGICSALL